MAEQTLDAETVEKLRELIGYAQAAVNPHSFRCLDEALALLPAKPEPAEPAPGPHRARRSEKVEGTWRVDDANGELLAAGLDEPTADLLSRSWLLDRANRASRGLLKLLSVNNDLCVRDRHRIDAHLAEYPACS